MPILKLVSVNVLPLVTLCVALSALDANMRELDESTRA